MPQLVSSSALRLSLSPDGGDAESSRLHHRNPGARVHPPRAELPPEGQLWWRRPSAQGTLQARVLLREGVAGPALTFDLNSLGFGFCGYNRDHSDEYTDNFGLKMY